MRDENIFIDHNEIYKEALYIEPRHQLPYDTVIMNLIRESFPDIRVGTDYIAHSNGIIFPVKDEETLFEPFIHFNYSFFNNKEKRIIHSPLVVVW
ncbi:hypothetical protein P4646_23290 [Peribacillus simplex]|uniref:hypothetical protein n=1 Tax=Peribacillus simplex TaxID=1478 RepID=UPI002E1A5B83|nr:hypothetical protein [Peribacillus simplex]MED4094225.1 hypothetical protein [Peribacillus simplex]